MVLQNLLVHRHKNGVVKEDIFVAPRLGTLPKQGLGMCVAAGFNAFCLPTFALIAWQCLLSSTGDSLICTT